jgi:hypothetical protein
MAVSLHLGAGCPRFRFLDDRSRGDVHSSRRYAPLLVFPRFVATTVTSGGSPPDGRLVTLR